VANKIAVLAIVCGAFLFAGCSKRERSDPDADEWADIQALADDAAMVPAGDENNQKPVPEFGEEVPVGEFGPFLRRLEAMKSADRAAGETLLTGEKLVFDYDNLSVRMEESVVVEDDQGTLKTARLLGRFTNSNEVDYVEASGGVEIVSSNRTASADHAKYDYKTGFVQMTGKASASDGANRLSGERIQLWIKGDRKMVCEPNALLEISADSGINLDGKSFGTSDGRVEKTEIRADKAVYDESRGLGELIGNVRLRDPRAAMNCDHVRLYLKDSNEIDWIEASGEVIIQSDDRKALADQATFHADEGKFTLLGEPKVKQGLHVMTGETIKVWIEPRRMVCEPNARVLLHLDEETKAKFLKDLDK
jgi:lipopolysaccharide transport protein LptA